MEWRAGTSGYSYKEWLGSFYPDKLAASRMLPFYAERLPCVEINNTFYRMPRSEVLAGWAEQVPDAFRFVVKAPQRITHMRRLKDAGPDVAYFLTTIQALHDRLGAVLFQLPPNLKVDVDRLRAFLGALPAGMRAAFEFRHPSWSDDVVREALRERNFALCYTDTGAPAGEDAAAEGSASAPAPLPPIVRTADWGYLRLRRPEYDDDQLREILRRGGESGWKDAFVFFKHEDAGTGPRLAARFLELSRLP